MVYVGVDLHRKSSHVAVLAGDGELLASRRIASRPEEFLRVLGELEPGPVEVAFEATYGWGWFADLLADVGIPAHMAHPLATKAISSARVKNDSVDAKTLAHLLRTNLLPEAWAAPPEVRDARKLARTRISLARISSRLKCQTHALLADQAILPPMTDLFGHGGRAFLEDVGLRPIPQARLEANLRLLDLLSPEVATADRELRELFRGDLRVKKLLPIPGIGFTTAAVVVAEVWDVSRFPLPRSPVLLGRAHPHRALQRRAHPAGPHLQAGIAVAQVGHGRIGLPSLPEGPHPPAVPGLDRPAPGKQDRQGGPRPAPAHPVLLRPPRRGRVPGLPGAPMRTPIVVGARSPQVMASFGTAALSD